MTNDWLRALDRANHLGTQTASTVSDFTAAAIAAVGTTFAPLDSPVFTGDPRAPTAAPGDSDTSIATTAFVQAVIAALNLATTYAPLASPALTGTPTAPTATLGTNTTQIASTAFVQAVIAALNLSSTYAPLASPALTGTPTAPTAATATNTTQLATTAFVQAVVTALSLASTYAAIAGQVYSGTHDFSAGALTALRTTSPGSQGTFGVRSTTDKFQWRGASAVFVALSQTDFSPISLTDAASVAVDMSAGLNFTLLTTAGVGATRAIANPTSGYNGQIGTIEIIQDATGSRTVTWGGQYKFAAATAFTLSTAANAKDRILYVVRSGTEIHMLSITKDIR